MMAFFAALKKIDWWVFVPVILLMAAGLVTMHSFDPGQGTAAKQLIINIVAVLLMLGLSFVDLRTLRRTGSVMTIYLTAIVLLVLLFFIGDVVKGARSWIDLGVVSLQPADFAKLALILLLAKYFTRRHIEMKRFKHLLVSGLYMLIPFILIILQPDFGSAIIVPMIWFGIIMVAGISRKHFVVLLTLVALVSVGLWSFVFADYQRQRIMTFLDPLSDIQGAGYNAHQSVIAVGSGQVLGKGLGYGSQSRLRFLPEYQTDFIYAAYSEEWGFVGALLVLILFAILIWRIIALSMRSADNFGVLVGVGTTVLFMTHIMVNIGMNLALLPVSGIPLPFLSRGGSHVIVECMLLGLVLGVNRYAPRRKTLHAAPDETFSLQ